MSKYQTITALYESTVTDVTATPAEWAAFLRSACRNYKCRFDEQLLIYAQRPDATAVLEIEKWNGQFGRWVNRGAKGIAVFDDTGKHLKHYFDISDTHESRTSRPVPIWQMKPENEAEVIETLESSFGELEDTSSLPAALVSAAKNATEDNIADYLRDITVSDMSEYQTLIRHSVAYMLLTRCGYSEVLHENLFQQITNYNSVRAINALGIAASDIAELCLREIAATVRQNRTFDTPQNQVYSVPDNHNEERGVTHGTDLSHRGGLPSPEPDPAGGNGLWQIRAATENVPEEAPQNPVPKPPDHRDTGRAPNRDRAGGERTNGEYGNANGGGTGGNGSPESDRPDGVGREDEQPPALSGGSDSPRIDLRITREAAEGANPSASSLPGVPQEVIDHELIRNTGDDIFQRRFHIYHQMKQLSSEEEAIQYLKRYFGIGGGNSRIDNAYWVESAGKGLTFIKGNLMTPDSKHTLSWQKAAKRIRELIAAERYLTPKDMEQYPKYLEYLEQQAVLREKERFIESAADLPPAEKRDTLTLRLTDYLNGLEEYEKKHLPSEIAGATSIEQIDAILRDPQRAEQLLSALNAIKGATSGVFTRNHAWRFGQELEVLYPRQYVYHLGDTVYIGTHEYEVLAFDESNVRLYDTEFPMVNVELPRDVFDKRIAENPLNAHLLKTVEAPAEQQTIEAPQPETPAITPAWEEPETLPTTTVTPQSERHNYHITDDDLGAGGPKAKYRANIEAIRTLQTVESENRLATPEEQEVLARYVGWGGIQQAFDPDNPSWANEYAELKVLLSPEEYASARASTLNAHYTSPTVIKAIYKTIENTGFRTGNILEPSCGTGNFFGLLPESMSDSKLYGVELDSVTGRIAKQLYQKNNIAIQGYETAELPDSFFDVAIGNVPFGSYSVSDKRYDKHKFAIHDYFFAKTLDKVRPGGVIAFVTSMYTMDKKNSAVRKYIAQRAELLGAIRLPNNAFSRNAGTEVTTDILFLQKRDRILDVEPEWIHLNQLTSDNGQLTIPINSYYCEHPDMILGTMTNESGSRMYGSENSYTCEPFPDTDLAEQLEDAIVNIHAEINEYERDEETPDNSIPADPSVRNFSYTLVSGDIYYRQDSRMVPVELPVTAQSRVKGLIELRECVRDLITFQTEDYHEEIITREQAKLNRLYDSYTKKYGLINSRGNSVAFGQDSSFCLLCSLEILDENGELERKADMFTKRTINPHIPITHVDTASEALAVSISEKAKVDLVYMSELTGMSEEALVKELEGVIFLNVGLAETQDKTYVTADEYLSGNIREKLTLAKAAAATVPSLEGNVRALEAAMPPDLTAAEISVRLGATWIPEEVIQRFMVELLHPSWYMQTKTRVRYSSRLGEWNISEKSADRSNIHVFNTYGTTRVNAYKILEDSLNLRDVRVFDKMYDPDGKERRVLNKKETAIAQAKQEIIRSKFEEWIWKDPNRREQLCRLYNDRFNSIRPRVYDGSHLRFVGMNPEIKLRKHQTDAIAHILYGGNTLLAHEVGAGKTFEMVAAAMESKRLGLSHKNLIVVPNHITEQWSAEFLQLYPSANILVATKKDFETKNRKKFCARIATGDYDAVIIGHSQFEKIPMSLTRQVETLNRQVDELVSLIEEMKRNRGERYSIKQIERMKKSLLLRLEKLNDQSRKDDVVTFEELGVDRLFVDESHFYKNLYLVTKMRNVAGIAQTEAQKSSDLFMKTQYLDEQTGGRGVVFATGTPISNSMVELYTIQRYLQYEELVKSGLQHFDSWASTFGETVTAIELAPEGTGYRAKTRFAKFYNLPELMSMFRMAADIQTADMLNLPVPKATFHTVVVKPSEWQKEMIAELAERAERVREGNVDPQSDNMLLITNDGRKLALDQRLINPMLPDEPDGKVFICADNIYRIWEETKENRSAQLVFCDLSTPKQEESPGFTDVYHDIRKKLIGKGIPQNEIAFIHDADTEVRKKELFAKVRKGQVRVLIGSTQKMGAGTNCQDRLIAIHDLECPWRPSDLAQRLGRIVRQGNRNPEVEVFRYVTEGTFDSYLYQLVENKQKFIAQIMTSKLPVRSAEDVDETALSYSEIKALATGNPLIIEKCQLEMDVNKLTILRASHLNQKYALEDKILKEYPQEIKRLSERIAGYQADIGKLKQNTPTNKEDFPPMKIGGILYIDKAEAGTALIQACQAMTSPDPVPLGEYRGFQMILSFDTLSRQYALTLSSALSHSAKLGTDVHGNITRINNVLDGFGASLQHCEGQLADVRKQMEAAKGEVDRPFPHDQEYAEKAARLKELNILLNMDQKDTAILDAEPDEGDMEPARKVERNAR